MELVEPQATVSPGLEQGQPGPGCEQVPPPPGLMETGEVSTGGELPLHAWRATHAAAHMAAKNAVHRTSFALFCGSFGRSITNLQRGERLSRGRRASCVR